MFIFKRELYTCHRATCGPAGVQPGCQCIMALDWPASVGSPAVLTLNESPAPTPGLWRKCKHTELEPHAITQPERLGCCEPSVMNPSLVLPEVEHRLPCASEGFF